MINSLCIIHEILDSLSGCIYFTHLDLSQGFYNLELEPDSSTFTAFHSGQLQMTRMTMGIKTQDKPKLICPNDDNGNGGP